jgi:hypothetical protein
MSIRSLTLALPIFLMSGAMAQAQRILVRAADHVRERAERTALGANFRSATNG